MKERITLSKSVALGEDLAATAFRPNYMYLFEDGVQIFFDPPNIPAQRIAYPNPEAKESAGVVVMPEKLAEEFKTALAAVLQLCKGRMENPFIEIKEPVKDPQPAEPLPGEGEIRGR